jgi:large subunit ribosomal protein L4
MKTNIVTLENKSAGEITLNKDVFGSEVRKDIIERVVRWQLAKKQSGTHKTKGISDISGTTAKPFNQKGTGRARQGSNRSAQMRGGATIFGPVVRSHAHKLPKKIRQLGLKSALSSKIADKKVLIVDSLSLSTPKTADLIKNIEKLAISSILFIDSELNDNFRRASANIKGIHALPTMGANVYDILKYDHLVLTKEAVKSLEERLA